MDYSKSSDHTRSSASIRFCFRASPSRMVRLRPLRIFFWSSSVPEIQTESNTSQHHHAVKRGNWDQHCLPLLPSLQVQPSVSSFMQLHDIGWSWHHISVLPYHVLSILHITSLKQWLRHTTTGHLSTKQLESQQLFSAGGHLCSDAGPLTWLIWHHLVGGLNPSEKILVKWDYYSQYMEK